MEVLSRLYVFFKRVLDIVGAIFALIIFSPISLYVALRIKLEDGGPIIYKQIRVGRHGSKFMMFKFRSMYVGAHENRRNLESKNETDGLTFKMKNDPRITSIGRTIRKHSLDEIPQFLNVLRGEMSLVGPRPALPEEVENYSVKELERLTIMPGITGLWQVSGRSNLTFNEMIDLDLKYLKTRSILLDLYILAKTATQMILNNDSGAY